MKLKTLSIYKLTVQRSFITNCGKEEVILKLQSYFDNTLRDLEMRPAFSGFVVSEVDFEIRSKWEMTFYRKPYKKAAYISGHLLPAPDGTTKILLTHRRKQLLRWYLIIPFLLPGMLIFSGLFVYRDTYITRAGVMALIFMATWCMFGLHYVSNRVIKKLTKLLMMKELTMTQTR